MNRTKIEWTDYTWNPVTGCWGPGGTFDEPNYCSYCYARTIAKRFSSENEYLGHDCTQPGGNLNEKRYKRGKPWRYGFEPTFHPYRLIEPLRVKKPAKIFVCSMADLFGDWVPDEWIEQIKVEAIHCPHHIFQFLTKNPKRYQEFNPWPGNCWLGTTVTNQTDADERLPWLLQADAPVRFVSHEPLLEVVNMSVRIPGEPHSQTHDATTGVSSDTPYGYIKSGITDPLSRGKVDWAIIGAQTGPGAVKPWQEWTRGLIDQYRAAGVPIFLKDNLQWPEKIKEWPKP